MAPAIKGLLFDLLVCTLFGSELATEITLAGLKRPFSFCSVESDA